jgi:hypothetical protein
LTLTFFPFELFCFVAIIVSLLVDSSGTTPTKLQV